MTEVSERTDADLAALAIECISELYKREQTLREAAVEAAQAQFPALVQAWKAAGLKMSTVTLGRGPVMTEWADVPVMCGVSTGYYGPKPKTKAAALGIARKFGDGGWMTMGEAWMFAAGYGPVIDRAMHKMGFGGKSDPPPPGYRKPAVKTVMETAEAGEP